MVQKSSQPIMNLLAILGQRWTLRILWELRDGPRTFRALQEACDKVSPTTLNARTKSLREAGFLYLGEAGFQLTESGRDLSVHLASMNTFAKKWEAGLQESSS